MLSDGSKAIVINQMHARIPNSTVVRDRWTNLCIDINSFIKECFTRHGTPYGTPQINPHSQAMAGGQNKQVGGGSGDIAALHSGKVAELVNGKAAALLAKNQQTTNSNSMKTVEVIQLEGTFKIRKIFTSRSQIPADQIIDDQFGAGGAGATGMSGGTMSA